MIENIRRSAADARRRRPFQCGTRLVGGIVTGLTHCRAGSGDHAERDHRT
ncbi:hypothetical protein KWH01_01795 [Xanthomonas campestris pv. merremiae]|nr:MULTISPECIES: hypothetical protein [Xanthomonas]MBV6836048.1 hypothetical protein [Xanthomonas campestris pv. merremiae]